MRRVYPVENMLKKDGRASVEAILESFNVGTLNSGTQLTAVHRVSPNTADITLTYNNSEATTQVNFLCDVCI